MRIILFTLVCFLFGCDKKPKAHRDFISIPLADVANSFDPAKAFDEVSLTAINQSYETLYEYEYLIRPFKLTPLLAEEMPKVSDDGKIYTIKIKPGVIYHSHPAFAGKKREVVAEDFVSQIKRVAYKGTESTGLWAIQKIVGVEDFRKKVGLDFSKFSTENISGVKAVDRYLLQIELEAQLPQFTNFLAMSFFVPMPLEVIEFEKNILTDQMIGTGPFELKNIVKGQKYVFEHFPDYHLSHYPSRGDRVANESGFLKDSGKKLPLGKKLEMIILTEEQKRFNAFLNKEIDFLQIPANNIEQSLNLKGELNEDLIKKGIGLFYAPGFTSVWLSFNMNNSVFAKNLNLRKAIAYAIPREELTAKFTSHLGQVANSIFVPGIEGYQSYHHFPYELNILKAKELLVLAGYPQGKGLNKIKFYTRGKGTQSLERAQFIKEKLKVIGIELEVIEVDFNEFLALSRAGKLEFWLDGWIYDYPDPENILQLLSSKYFPPGGNKTMFSNSLFDAIYETVTKQKEIQQKEQLLDQANQIVVEELPWIPLYYQRNYFMYHTYLKNFRYSNFIRNQVKYLRIQ